NAPGGINLDTDVDTFEALTDNSNITIRQAKRLALGLVDAGTADVDISLSKGALTDNNGAGNNNITGNDLIINAPGGINLDTDVDTFEAFTSNNDIIIREANDLALNMVDAGTADVDIRLINGAITDGNADAANVIANRLNLFAQNGIGSLDAIETEINVLSARNTTTGDIRIYNFGSFLIDSVINDAAGVIIGTDGSIDGVSKLGYHIIAKDDSLIYAPKGTIGLVTPLNVSIKGNLVLDIGGAVGLNSGRLTGTINSPVGEPVFLPSSFPDPLCPPGNVYWNGLRIWPSPTAFMNAQALSGLLSRFSLPNTMQLANYRINSFDSPLAGNVYFYHPLTPTDMRAFDSVFVIEEGAYQFIDGNLDIFGHDGLLPMLEDLKKKKKELKDSEVV
ncbi:MAG: hypothetical protein ABIH18_09260, partial [Candidatus Omnitrophota bacterium]